MFIKHRSLRARGYQLGQSDMRASDISREKVYFKSGRALTETVPKVFEFRPADWPEKYFSGQSEDKLRQVTGIPQRRTVGYSINVNYRCFHRNLTNVIKNFVKQAPLLACRSPIF